MHTYIAIRHLFSASIHEGQFIALLHHLLNPYCAINIRSKVSPFLEVCCYNLDC